MPEIGVLILTDKLTSKSRGIFYLGLEFSLDSTVLQPCWNNSVNSSHPRPFSRRVTRAKLQVDCCKSSASLIDKQEVKVKSIRIFGATLVFNWCKNRFNRWEKSRLNYAPSAS
jgi:hypothetical protein